MKKVKEGYKMTDLGEIPHDWDIKKIDDTYYSFAASGICGLFKISDKISKWDAVYAKKNNTYGSFNKIGLIKSNGNSPLKTLPALF